MKKIVSIAIVSCIFFLANAQVEFREVVTSDDMDQVWADAATANKPVFVDIYATWCGPCKWLDANVFALKEAGDYMNQTFINVKMDGETEFGRVFAMKSGLSAYPSLFIFNSEQKLMNMLVGAKPWEELKPAMESTLENYPVLEMLQSKFESNLLEKEEYPRFILALRKMGKDTYGSAVAEKYTNDFVNADQRSEADIQVLAYYTPQQSEEWSMLVADIPVLKSALEDDLENFIDFALTNSIESSVENGNLDYILAFQEILPALAEGTSLDSEEMESRAYIYYYHYSGMIDEMIEYIDTEYTKREGKHTWLFMSASNAVFLDPQNKKVAEKGLEWFSECLSHEKNQEYYYHLALCEYFTGSQEQAVASLLKSLEYTDDQNIIDTTNSIIEQIKAEIEQVTTEN
jgi:thioredoxin-like negative regulator of GroEL